MPSSFEKFKEWEKNLPPGWKKEYFDQPPISSCGIVLSKINLETIEKAMQKQLEKFLALFDQ